MGWRTKVNVSNPDNTMLVVRKNGYKSWEAPENLSNVDHNSHEYLGETEEGFQVIGEKENRKTKKGLFEAALGLFLGG